MDIEKELEGGSKKKSRGLRRCRLEVEIPESVLQRMIFRADDEGVLSRYGIEHVIETDEDGKTRASYKNATFVVEELTFGEMQDVTRSTDQEVRQVALQMIRFGTRDMKMRNDDVEELLEIGGVALQMLLVGGCNMIMAPDGIHEWQETVATTVARGKRL